MFAQPNSMLAMSSGVIISAEAGGQSKKQGWMGGLKNVLLGESFFTAVYRAKRDGESLILAPPFIGEVLHLEISSGTEFYLTRGAYLASSPGVRIEVEYGGVKGVLAQKGLFLMKATGQGHLFCSSYGAIVCKELADQEIYVVDNRYVVAFESKVTYKLVKATEKIGSSIFSGEGLVNRYTGPGVIYYQTRPKQGLSSGLLKAFDAAT